MAECQSVHGHRTQTRSMQCMAATSPGRAAPGGGGASFTQLPCTLPAAGKFIVDYNIHNYGRVPKGFTDFDALTMPFTFNYYNPAFSRNGEAPRHYPGGWPGGPMPPLHAHAHAHVHAQASTCYARVEGWHTM